MALPPGEYTVEITDVTIEPDGNLLMALRRTNKLCTRCQGAVAEHFIAGSGDYLCDHCDLWHKQAATADILSGLLGGKFDEALKDYFEEMIQLEAARNSK